MRVITVYYDKRGEIIIITYVSAYDMQEQEQSVKANLGQIKRQVVETSYQTHEYI